MSNVLVTFGGKAYDETIKMIVDRAPGFGVDRVIVADDKWLMTKPFYTQHRWLWETPIQFGFGWCSWKPYVIRYVLDRLNYGDALLYTDADTYPVRDLTPLFDLARREGIALFEEQGCDNKRFTKRDCFIAMDCDVPECHSMIQACGRFQAFKKPSRFDFLGDWEKFSVDPLCQLWDKSVIAPGDYKEFHRHSCEQSVLTNLAFLYSIPLHRTPDQAGGAPRGTEGFMDKDWDIYPQLFVQSECRGNRGDLSGSRFRNIDDLR